MTKPNWERLLEPYAPSKEVRRVPECDSVSYKIFECSGPLNINRIKTWICNGTTVEFENPIRLPVRFGYNHGGLGNTKIIDGNGDSYNLSLGLRNRREDSVKAPSNCIQFGDAPVGSGLPNSSLGKQARKIPRHGNQSNMAFVDGHVESRDWLSWYHTTPTARKRWNIDNEPHLELLKESQ
jgi:prepilin-type processing-associated H-X9-DG protein